MSARRLVRKLVLVGCGVLMAVPVVAQDRPAVAAPKPDPQAAARYQVAVMEGVLEAAVQHGARTMGRQMQAAMPQMLLMGGTARARGFRLDGYGVFFDVDVPAMRQSLIWTWRVLDRENGGAAGALESLRNVARNVTDPGQKAEIEQAIRRLEVQVAPFSGVADTIRPADAPKRDGQTATVAVPAAGGTSPAARVTPPEARHAEAMADPNDAYTGAVKDALIDAMLGHSQALEIAPEEWLTVAARDAGDPRMSADDPFDVVTILIRIKGSDLAALHTGRISRDEARKRVDVREY
ncbi:MAG: hypothetical protein NTY02_01815 [Acidobacteria bacterium]|nr:hypothetical protein [Acidobacteriota bacterium]